MAAKGDTGGLVSGQTVSVTIDGVMSVFQRRTRNLLNEHGITEPDPRPDGWYDMDAFLGVLNDVQENTGENALKKIGEATPNHLDWPTAVDGPIEALEALNDVYQETHRDATGGYAVEQVDDVTVRVTADTPYLCRFDRGLLKGAAEAFGDVYARVDEVGSSCRDDDGRTCINEVTW